MNMHVSMFEIWLTNWPNKIKNVTLNYLTAHKITA